jgi:pyruvate dehydrogenase E2 component (dihydrolipoamide acetyltransferase)
MSDISQINIPDLGDVDEVEVIEICVEVGQKVESEDSIMILETDKAAMEIPASADGVVKNILIKVGDMVKEGMPFVEIEIESQVEELKKEDDTQITSNNEDKKSIDTIEKEISKEITIIKPAIPDLGDVDEVEVIEICVEVGQKVESEDSIMILETDKAAMEIPASADGVVKNILIKVGDMVKEGMPFVELETIINEVAQDNKQTKNEDNELAQSEKITSQENIELKKKPTQPINFKNTSVHSGPATRKLAREFGIDLSQVKGSGPKGRIIKEDLHAFVSSKLNSKDQEGFQHSQPDIDYSKWGDISIEKLSKFQKTASKNLHTSWINIPHVTQHNDSDITDLLELRSDLNKKHKTKVSPLAFIIKATVETLKLFPMMNTSLTSDLESFVIKEYFNIGIAVDTPEGLIVPNIKDAEKKSILEISDEVMSLAKLAKERKLKVDQLKGATFTISSLSGIGGKYFTPIINPPEVAILGLSKTFDHLLLDGEKVLNKKYLPVSLSYDHRVINGAYAAKFVTEFSNQLKQINFLKESFNES